MADHDINKDEGDTHVVFVVGGGKSIFHGIRSNLLCTRDTSVEGQCCYAVLSFLVNQEGDPEAAKAVMKQMELREYEPTTPLPLSSSKFNKGVRQMFEEMEISVK